MSSRAAAVAAVVESKAQRPTACGRPASTSWWKIPGRRSGPGHTPAAQPAKGHQACGGAAADAQGKDSGSLSLTDRDRVLVQPPLPLRLPALPVVPAEGVERRDNVRAAPLGRAVAAGRRLGHQAALQRGRTRVSLQLQQGFSVGIAAVKPRLACRKSAASGPSIPSPTKNAVAPLSFCRCSSPRQGSIASSASRITRIASSASAPASWNGPAAPPVSRHGPRELNRIPRLLAALGNRGSFLPRCSPPQPPPHAAPRPAGPQRPACRPPGPHRPPPVAVGETVILLHPLYLE